jgi:hypothetical protein
MLICVLSPLSTINLLIILGLGSKNEWEQVNLAYFTQHDDLQFQPFICKWHNFTFLYVWIKPHGVCIILFIHSSVVGHFADFMV